MRMPLPLLLLLLAEPACECSSETTSLDAGLDAEEGEAGRIDASATDASAVLDAAATYPDTALDADCTPTVPVPGEHLACGPCEPGCFVTREMPGPDDLALDAEHVAHDERSGGVALEVGPDARYASVGRARRVHEARGCDPVTEWVEWRQLAYETELPEGTSIEFELRTAETEAALGEATPVVVRATSGVGVIDVHDELRRAGAPWAYLLSVTAVLHASPDRTRTPTLLRYDLRYSCLRE